MSESKPKCVLAYSGGLDTSVILQWLCEKGFDVIAFCADVGQHHEDFEAVKAKAVTCGAIKCVVTDLRKGAFKTSFRCAVIAGVFVGMGA